MTDKTRRIIVSRMLLYTSSIYGIIEITKDKENAIAMTLGALCGLAVILDFYKSYKYIRFSPKYVKI